MSAVDRPPRADPDWPDDAIEVGRIGDAWGLKGWFKVLPFADDPQALFSSRRWFILPSDRVGALPLAASAAATMLPSLLTIEQVKVHGDGVVALAQQVGDRSAAETLRGARVYVSRASFPTAGPDEFYWVDLIGLSVVNRTGVALGTVAGLIDTGPHSVLRLNPEGAGPGAVDAASERLIPFVAAYVDSISLEQRLIRVDWEADY